MRKTLLPCLLVVIWACVCLAEPVPLSDVKLDYGRLKSWGKQEYRVMRRTTSDAGVQAFEKTAYCTMETVVGPDGTEIKTWLSHADRGLLRDFARAGGQTGRKVPIPEPITLQGNCRSDSYLSPLTTRVYSDWLTHVCTYKNGRRKVNRGIRGARTSSTYPADAVQIDALYRIVAALPRTKGKAYSFGEIVDPFRNVWWKPDRAAPTHIITCRGPVLLKGSGGNVPCTKYEVSGDPENIVVYINKADVPHTIIRDDTYMLLLTKGTIAKELAAFSNNIRGKAAAALTDRQNSGDGVQKEIDSLMAKTRKHLEAQEKVLRGFLARLEAINTEDEAIPVCKDIYEWMMQPNKSEERLMSDLMTFGAKHPQQKKDGSALVQRFMAEMRKLGPLRQKVSKLLNDKGMSKPKVRQAVMEHVEKLQQGK